MSFIDNIDVVFEANDKDALSSVRESALTSFKTLGIPSARHEEWKYTHIKTKLPETLTLAPAAKGNLVSQAKPLKDSIFNNAIKLVFVNGVFDKEASTQSEQNGLIAGSFRELKNSHSDIYSKYFNTATDIAKENFAALNTAFAQDGAFVFVKKGVIADKPIYIIHQYDEHATDIFTQCRNLVVVEDNAAVNIVEDFYSSVHFYNHLSEVFIGQNAEVNYYYLQLDTKGSSSVNYVEAKLARDARYHLSTITFDGKLVRNNMNAYMEGENALATLNGLYIGTAENHIDNHILVDHRVPNCNSNQVYKGVLDDASTGVFNGKIFVQPDAQKTNAFQSSKAILLSDEASMNSKPQLEIFADDVKCSHGAAIGNVNKNELFYLLARGIDENTARGILTYAFANDVIQAITMPKVREYLDSKLRERLKIDI
jgi:Fe-S cluster assembly protein SufD